MGTVKKTVSAVKQATGDSRNTYVDDVLYSETLGVVMTSQLTDDIPPSTSSNIQLRLGSLVLPPRQKKKKKK
ncbi:hypothetical protein B0I37DRAFT_384806, partial [Chaetomium sp. MPI-CAGE-AT-0009]